MLTWHELVGVEGIGARKQGAEVMTFAVRWKTWGLGRVHKRVYAVSSKDKERFCCVCNIF